MERFTKEVAREDGGDPGVKRRWQLVREIDSHGFMGLEEDPSDGVWMLVRLDGVDGVEVFAGTEWRVGVMISWMGTARM